jgi:oligopeptidase B
MKMEMPNLIVPALVLCVGVLITGCSAPEAPIAEVKPHQMEAHGQMRVDNYYWLRDRENPEVIAYLEAENSYLAAGMKHTEKLQDEIFEEIKGRIKKDDSSVPYLEAGDYRYTRFEEGKEYRIHCRRRGGLDAPEEILLDENELATDEGFFSLRSLRISSDKKLLAFGVDRVGRRFYTLHFKDLASGELLPDVIPDVSANLVWAADNRTVFYARKDPDTLRPYQILRHVLGTDPADDVLVYEEQDETFACWLSKSKSRDYLFINSDQTLSSEVRYLAATDPTGEFRVILPREEKHEYSVEHLAGRFYIRTNWEAENFRLMATPVMNTEKRNWREVVGHREDTLLVSFELFSDYLVLTERFEGLDRLRVSPWSGEGEHYIEFSEPAYMAYVSRNLEMDSHTLRYGYTSMTTPSSTFDYDLRSREQVLLKQDEVLGDYEAADYKVERLFAEARDGERVPISIVYPKGFPRDGVGPLYLYAYGSYGGSMSATFSASRLSMLERGFAFAIAHVRGGQEMGRRWYDEGKLLKKWNTFHDFIDCAQFLIDEGYTSSDRLFAMGGSAGGLLTGVVLNEAPELFRGVISDVAFVDVVTTMLDESIPLTTGEYDEWGNPNVKEYYDYMLSYSPYDQVKAQAYPHMLMTAGLHDSQVQYWEPAKWVAKLRTMKTDDNRLYLKTNMEAGHGGQSGRFRRYRETALAYAFMLDLLPEAE